MRGVAVQFRPRHGVSIGRIVEGQNPLQARDDLAEDFQTFWTQFEVQIGHPRDVATGPGEALDQAQPYGVDHISEDDRKECSLSTKKAFYSRLIDRKPALCVYLRFLP